MKSILGSFGQEDLKRPLYNKAMSPGPHSWLLEDSYLVRYIYR